MQEQVQWQGQQEKEKPKHEYDNYLIFLHKQRVEVHINYGNTIMKLEGVVRSKARYDIQIQLANGGGGSE